MAKLEFEDIKFSEDKEYPDVVIVTFMRIFETRIDKASLKRLGEFRIKDEALEFGKVSDLEAKHKFMPLLNSAFNSLTNKLTKRKAVYVHRNSGIPLVGSIYFGIVDRGTNILEVKPITGCNIGCVFCSVNEDASRKCVDFVVEDDYLAQEVKNIIEFKQQGAETHSSSVQRAGSAKYCERSSRFESDAEGEVPYGREPHGARSSDKRARRCPSVTSGRRAPKAFGRSQKSESLDRATKIDIFINTHGEPLLYSPMERLVKALRAIKQVRTIAIITNGTLLSRQLIDRLAAAGLTQLNMSVNAIDESKAKELAGSPGYDINHVLDMARYAAGKLKLIIAPVWISGKNDDQIPKIIGFAKEIGAEIGIQNYMVHKMGKKISKELSWEEFYSQLEQLEKSTGAKLKAEYHATQPTKPLEKPFKKDDTVKAEIVCPGRMKGEMLAAAKGRVISIINCTKERGSVKAHIVKDKDNIFVAEEVR